MKASEKEQSMKEYQESVASARRSLEDIPEDDIAAIHPESAAEVNRLFEALDALEHEMKSVIKQGFDDDESVSDEETETEEVE